MPNINDQTIQLVIIGVAALAVVMQAVVLIAILFAMKKAATAIHRDIQELRASVTPIILDSRDFIERTVPRVEDFITNVAPRIEDFITSVAPKIESTASDVSEIVHTVRVKTAEAEITVTEILARAQHQTSRMDGMVTTALDSVEKVGGFLDKTVSKPVKQISALVAAGRAVVQSLNATSSRSHSSNGAGSNGSGNHDP